MASTHYGEISLYLPLLSHHYSATSAPPTASSSVVSPSPPPSSVLVRVPLAPSLSIGPNVCPPSSLILATGVLLVWLVSHQVTITFAPSAAISAFIESTVSVLLRLVLFPNVAPPSLEALNITSPFVFGVPLSVHYTMYMFSPVMTAGAFGRSK